MSKECLVHDMLMVGACTCSPERKWARDKMLLENLEKIATPPIPADTKEEK